jgi:hypothetical protein
MTKVPIDPQFFLFMMTSFGKATKWRAASPSVCNETGSWTSNQRNRRGASGVKRRARTVSYHGIQFFGVQAWFSSWLLVQCRHCALTLDITLADGHTSLQKLPSSPLSSLPTITLRPSSSTSSNWKSNEPYIFHITNNSQIVLTMATLHCKYFEAPNVISSIPASNHSKTQLHCLTAYRSTCRQAFGYCPRHCLQPSLHPHRPRPSLWRYIPQIQGS